MQYAVGGAGRGAKKLDIFPDPMSAMLADGWYSSATKVLERQNAAILQTALAPAGPATP